MYDCYNTCFSIFRFIKIIRSTNMSKFRSICSLKESNNLFEHFTRSADRGWDIILRNSTHSSPFNICTIKGKVGCACLPWFDRCPWHGRSRYFNLVTNNSLWVLFQNFRVLPFLCKRTQTVCGDQQSKLLFKMIKTMKVLLRGMF